MRCGSDARATCHIEKPIAALQMSSIEETGVDNSIVIFAAKPATTVILHIVIWRLEEWRAAQ
jgi:hypothetical protein